MSRRRRTGVGHPDPVELTRREQRELDRLRDVVFDGQATVHSELGMEEPGAGNVTEPSKAVADERIRDKENYNDTHSELQLQLYE